MPSHPIPQIPPLPGDGAYLRNVVAGNTRIITLDSNAWSGIGVMYIRQEESATNILTVAAGNAGFAVIGNIVLEATNGLIQVWVQSNLFSSLYGGLVVSNTAAGASVVTIDAPASLYVSNNVDVFGGALTNAGTANVGGTINLIGAARWVQLGGSVSAAALTNGVGGTFTMSNANAFFTNLVDNAGTFTLTSGTNTTPIFRNRAGATLSQSGGEMNVNYVTNQATWTISGTAVANLTNFVGMGSVLNVTGGRLAIANLINATNGTGTINVSGGSITVGGGVVAATSNGTINMNGGTFAWTTAPILASGASARGTINLNAGVLTVPGLTNGNGVGSIFFNGGTLQFSSNATVGGISNFAVMVGGAVIDSSNYTVSFAQPLTNGLGGGADGGLTKTGNGALILTNGNNYNGPTRVLAGSLIGTNIPGTLTVAPGGSVGPTNVLAQWYLDWLNGVLSGSLTGAVVMSVNSDSNLLFISKLADTFLGSAAPTGATYYGVATWTNNPGAIRLGGGAGLLIYPAVISPQNGWSNVIIGPVGGNALSVVLLNNPVNNYAGGTIVNSGTLRLGGPSVLGSPTGAVLVAVNSGGALDLNGYNISTLSQTVMISGMGIGPAGAIYNSGANLINVGVRNVSFTNDAAVGGPGGRFDILGVLNGNGNRLFKVGTNPTFMAGAGYVTNIPFIVINGGLFGIQGAGQLAGAGATVIQAYTGGTFGVYGNLAFTNALELDGGTFQNNGPANSVVTWNGPVSINGTTNFFDTGPGLAMVINGNISGTGLLAKINANALILAGNNSYSGGTFVSNGVLQFVGSNAIPLANGISVSGTGIVQFNFTNSQAGFNRLDPTNAVGVVALTAANVNDNIDLATPNLSNVWIGAVNPVSYSGVLTPYGSSYQLGGGGGTLVLNGSNLQSAAILRIGGGPQSGTVLMNGANSFGGGAANTIIHSNAVLSIGGLEAIGGAGAGLTFSGGTLQVRGTSLVNLDNAVVNWVSSATGNGIDGGLDINIPGNIFTVTNDINGYGITNKLGYGTLVLSGNNTFSTQVYVRAGALRIAGDTSMGQPGGPAVVAGGISEALVCTAFGLFIGIPTLFFANYFSKKAADIASILESTSDLVVVISERVKGSAAS